MITVHCAQGSEEWKLARAGRITASNFHLVRASARIKIGRSKGDYSSAAKDYAFRIAIERISGTCLDEGFETWAMRRGHELEPEARRAHEIQSGVIVEPTGFVMTDDGVFGASLDGIIGDDGSSEYKCFVDPCKLRDIIIDDDWSLIMDQAQGGLWITGRKWIDICLYCPALQAAGRQITVQRFARDDDYINDLESDLIDFMRLVCRYESLLRTHAASVQEKSSTPADLRNAQPTLLDIFE